MHKGSFLYTTKIQILFQYACVVALEKNHEGATVSKEEIKIDWTARLIRVKSSTYEISLQSLVNKISEEQATFRGMAEQVIADWTGKQPLTAGRRTQITITLKNGWHLTFEKVKHAQCDHPWICRVIGGGIGRDDGRDPFLETGNFFIQNVISMHEKFTILPSTSQLEMDFQRWIQKCDEDDLPLCLCYFDIDNFKNLNDKYTETVVDKTILVPYQEFLREVVRPFASVYSEGGDEFVLLLPGCPINRARQICEVLRAKTKTRTYSVKSVQLGFTISMGLAQRKHGEELESLKMRANKAKKSAKDQGRDRLISEH